METQDSGVLDVFRLYIHLLILFFVRRTCSDPSTSFWPPLRKTNQSGSKDKSKTKLDTSTENMGPGKTSLKKKKKGYCA